MEIRQFKLLDLIQTEKNQLTAKLEIDKIIRNVKVDFQYFDSDFYGFQLPEDVNIILRNYPKLSRKVMNCFGDYLEQKSLLLPIDFSSFVQRQNIATQLEQQAA